MNQRWLFVCSCIALITSAFTFSLHGDIMQDMGRTFGFTQEQNGAIGQAIFYGMAGSMFFGGFICDGLGIKNILWLALLSHLSGALGMIFTMNVVGADASAAYWPLYISGFLMGCGNGFTEVGINPLVATLFPNSKTHYLNVLHAWWPGGLIIGGLSAVFVRNQLFTGDTTTILGLQHFQFTLALMLIPAVIYGAMLLPAKFPSTERVASGVSNADMFKETMRPMFWLWMGCMLLTAATELGPQKWQNSVITSTTNGAVSGTLILVYTSGMMFVLRHFAGPIAKLLSPVGMLTVSATLSGIGLYLLSFANNATTAFTYATIFGLGIAYFWPTMLGVAAERFPKGGALILALMGTAGNISIAFVLPVMGGIADASAVQYVEQQDPGLAEAILKKNDAGKPIALNMEAAEAAGPESEELKVAKAAEATGFSQAFRKVSFLPAILVVVFGAIAISDKIKGGYKPDVIISDKEQAELMSGGAQGEVL